MWHACFHVGSRIFFRICSSSTGSFAPEMFGELSSEVFQVHEEINGIQIIVSRLIQFLNLKAVRSTRRTDMSCACRMLALPKMKELYSPLRKRTRFKGKFTSSKHDFQGGKIFVFGVFVVEAGSCEEMTQVDRHDTWNFRSESCKSKIESQGCKPLICLPCC